MNRPILTCLVLACALCVGGPSPASAKEGGRRSAARGSGPADAALAKLNLSDEQKSKIQAIKEKFSAEMKKWESDHKAEMDAARAAKDRQKMKPLMEQRQAKLEGLVAEIKGVLTEDQKVQFQQAMDAAKADAGKRGERKKKK